MFKNQISNRADAAATPDGRRIQTRRSGVHGKGVFALCDLAEGETLIEYVGEIISWREALRRHPHDPKEPNHTFYFHIDAKHVIDAKVGGNSSRWINHACQPNCEADEDGGRVFIKALRNIKAGEELFYNYGLIIDAKYTPKLLADYPCWCGAKKCRGTLLARKEKLKPKEARALADVKAAARAVVKAAAKSAAKSEASAKPETKTKVKAKAIPAESKKSASKRD